MDISLLVILSVLLTKSACDVCVPEDIDSGQSDVCHGTAKMLSSAVHGKEAYLVSVRFAFQRIALTYAVEGLPRDDMAISCRASENTAIDHAGVQLLPYNSSHLHIYVPVVIEQFTELDRQQLKCTLWEMTFNMPFPADEIVTWSRKLHGPVWSANLLMGFIVCTLHILLLWHCGCPGASVLLVAHVIIVLLYMTYIYVLKLYLYMY